MTHIDQIAAYLMILVERIGNELPADGDYDTARVAEWAYVKGIAASEILRLRDRLLSVAPSSSLRDAVDRPPRRSL